MKMLLVKNPFETPIVKNITGKGHRFPYLILDGIPVGIFEHEHPDHAGDLAPFYDAEYASLEPGMVCAYFRDGRVFAADVDGEVVELPWIQLERHSRELGGQSGQS